MVTVVAIAVVATVAIAVVATVATAVPPAMTTEVMSASKVVTTTADPVMMPAMMLREGGSRSERNRRRDRGPSENSREFHTHLA